MSTHYRKEPLNKELVPTKSVCRSKEDLPEKGARCVSDGKSTGAS